VSQRKTVFKFCVPHQHSSPLEAEGKKGYYLWIRTPERERAAGAIKSRDGGGEGTSKPRNAKKQGNAG
jgi:hypothetical protein